MAPAADSRHTVRVPLAITVILPPGAKRAKRGPADPTSPVGRRTPNQRMAAWEGVAQDITTPTTAALVRVVPARRQGNELMIERMAVPGAPVTIRSSAPQGARHGTFGAGSRATGAPRWGAWAERPSSVCHGRREHAGSTPRRKTRLGLLTGRPPAGTVPRPLLRSPRFRQYG